MPPRGHSGSSRSSSSRSSSRSSSSSSSSRSSGPSRHSSSSHYSSSSSSRGPSTRSSSSHRSSYSSGFGGPSSHSRSTSSPIVPAYVPRQRVNQPEGYRRSKPPKRFYCRNHDYFYYAESWVDQSTGRTYEKGYYDENGVHHPNVIIKKDGSGKVKFTCQYCGTEVKTEWIEGQRPTCPNCSAPLEEAEVDELLSTQTTKPVRRKQRDEDFIIRIVCLSAVGLIVFGLLFFFVIGLMEDDTPAPNYQPPDNTYSDSIYVEEIGRDCPWLAEYESYYDYVTDCYFWYNDTNPVSVWQYWYEGISSDFEDSGWMEYDEAEEQWYIEADYDEWIPLPEEYSTENLWYIHEE